MIDFEKLELAFDLAKKAGAYLHVGVSNRLKPITTHTKDIVMKFEEDYAHKPYGSIDHVIEALQEYLRPKPKYSVGQTVWIESRMQTCDLVVSEVYFSEGFVYRFLDHYNLAEQHIFESKKDVIKHYADHWNKMLEEEECSTR